MIRRQRDYERPSRLRWLDLNRVRTQRGNRPQRERHPTPEQLRREPELPPMPIADYPRIPGDPDKVLRASAFAGWVFAPSDPTRSLARLSELVARYARLR
jgi:hypothetical protein